MSTDAALRKERRTNFINATGLDRKSGEAQWRGLQVPLTQNFLAHHVLKAFMA
jgi:hypothetical protein